MPTAYSKDGLRTPKPGPTKGLSLAPENITVHSNGEESRSDTDSPSHPKDTIASEVPLMDKNKLEESSPADSPLATLSVEEANELVEQNYGWAESIARSVARAWGLDWRLDGLDGAAMEALIFCARRFQPDRGIPFRGYARRRIHEAATEAARRSRGWSKGMSKLSPEERKARELSADLLNVFPELRAGELPLGEDDSGGEDGMRNAVRSLLMGASLLSAKEGITETTPEDLVDYKRLIRVLAALEPVHQLLMWKVYWEGMSLRGVAGEWDTDGLNVIREHKTLLTYLQRSLAAGKQNLAKPKVRPGLRPVVLSFQRRNTPLPFSSLIQQLGSGAMAGP